MTISLRKRMLMVALLPATLVAVLLTAVFLFHAIDNLEQGLRTRGTAISRQMATTAEYGIFSGNRAGLSLLTESTLRIDPDVHGAAIFDEQGALMARSGELNPGDWPPFERIEGRHLGRHVLLFIEPVRRGNVSVDDIYAGTEGRSDAKSKALGHVVVELSTHEVSAKSERLIAAGVLIAMIGAALGGGLTRRIGRAVADPLLEANEVVAKIGKGDLTARMATESAGPLQPLAAGINDMVQRIGVTQEDLRARIAEATRSLMREKEAAEHATMAKSHFLAAASHDLRQPLHALGLFVSSLAQSDAARYEPRLVAQIQTAVDTLQDLLDAILDISRLDRGHIVPEISSFPLGPMLGRLTRDLALLAEQKGLQLKMRPAQVWVRSDPKIVERILLNLVGNALRYTQSGGVLVNCRHRGDLVLVEIWDTGEGIPEHARETIFEDYVQLGNPERDRNKGLGLGLAICRRLAGLLEMPIGVRSRPGRGSVFWIELPVAREQAFAGAPAAELPPARQAADAARIAGTVLVVDGDALVRASMERAIISWGGSVILAASREGALRRCRESEQPPDLMICNLRLPGGVDGIDLVQELQREFENMAVLLISADVSEKAQAVARRAGFALLKEPVPPGRLRAALRHLLAVRS